MPYINIKCENCSHIFSVIKTPEIGINTKSLSCNWCTNCEDDATDYYKETHYLDDIFGEPNPNQTKLF